MHTSRTTTLFDLNNQQQLIVGHADHRDRSFTMPRASFVLLPRASFVLLLYTSGIDGETIVSTKSRKCVY